MSVLGIIVACLLIAFVAGVGAALAKSPVPRNPYTGISEDEPDATDSAEVLRNRSGLPPGDDFPNSVE